MQYSRQIKRFIHRMAIWNERKVHISKILLKGENELNKNYSRLKQAFPESTVVEKSVNEINRVNTVLSNLILVNDIITLNTGFNKSLDENSEQYESIFIDNEYAIENKLQATKVEEGWKVINIPLFHQYDISVLLYNKSRLIQIDELKIVNPNTLILDNLLEGSDYHLGAVTQIKNNIYEVDESSFILFPRTEKYCVKEGVDNFFAVMRVRDLN